MAFKKHLPKPDPEAEEKFREELYNNGGLEKNDLAAMIVSAFLVFLPVALIALLLVCVVALFFI